MDARIADLYVANKCLRSVAMVQLAGTVKHGARERIGKE